jgi:hypothetical protein
LAEDQWRQDGRKLNPDEIGGVPCCAAGQNHVRLGIAIVWID